MFTTLKQTSIAVATITALTLGGNFATSTTAEAAGFAPSLSTANIVETVETENYIIVAKAKGGKSSFKGGGKSRFKGGRKLNRTKISKGRIKGKGRPGIKTNRDIKKNRGGRVVSRNPILPTVPGAGNLPNLPDLRPTNPGIQLPPGGLVVQDPLNPCGFGNCTVRPQPPQKGKKRIKRGIYIQANTRHCHKKIRKHRHVHKHSKKAHIHAHGCKTYRVQP